MEKKYNLIRLASTLLVVTALTFYTYMALASIDGRTGRTLKTSTSGCGSCHGSRDVTTSVVISGPSSVSTGSTNTYTLTITRATKTGAGCDIAAKTGTLAPVSSTIHLSGTELTHNDNIPMTGNTVSILFSYTAPSSPVSDTLFATALATNSNGNETGDLWNWATSFRVNVVPPPKILHLTSMMEGFYDPSTGKLTKDTARVFMRNTGSPYAIIDSAKAFLDSLGKADFSYSAAANGISYYIVVKHRNSIETWSSAGNSFVSNSMTYNFTTSAAQAFGSNLVLVGTKWTFFSGDANQDGTIDAGDIIDVYNDVTIGNSGYLPTDVNGDDFVDVSDLIIAYNNSVNVVSVITP